MFDTEILLSYRLIASIVICAFFTIAAIASLSQVIFRRENGIYTSMSLVCAITAMLFGVFVWISYVDVCQPDHTAARDWVLLSFDVIFTLLPISFTILGVQFVRSAD